MKKQRTNDQRTNNPESSIPSSVPVQSFTSTGSNALPDDLVLQARALREEGASLGSIAKQLGVSKSSVWSMTKDISPQETRKEQVSSELEASPPQGAVPTNLAAVDAIERMRIMSGKQKPEIIAHYENLLREASQSNETFVGKPSGDSPFRRTIPNLFAQRLAGLADASYLQGLGIDPKALFGSQGNDGSRSSTSELMKELREYSLTINLLERLNPNAKNDPFMEQLRTEMKATQERLEKLRDDTHRKEIEELKERVEAVKSEKSDIAKMKELLDQDPDLKPYIMKKLGIKSESDFFSTLQKLGVDLKQIKEWATELVNAVKNQIQSSRGPPPPSTEPPSERELVERSGVAEQLPNLPKLAEEGKGTFAEPEEIESAQEEKPKPTGYSTRELSKGKSGSTFAQEGLPSEEEGEK